jgi:competence protein ComEC
MDWWLLTFFLGAILSLFLPEVPALFQLFLLLFVAIGFYCAKNLRFSSGLWFGALWILTQAYLYHSQLPKNFIDLMHNKQVFVVEGEVLSIQTKPLNVVDEKISENTRLKKTALTKRFNFLVNQVNRKKLASPFIIRLSWQKSSIALAQGQQLLLNVKLKPAHGLANIGTFNYLSWLKAHNIVATGYVVNPKKKKILPHTPIKPSNLTPSKHVKTSRENTLLLTHKTLRQKLLEQYQGLIPPHELTPILLALAFGERSLLSQDLWKVLQATGTSHLIAISGLHIGLLAGSAFFIMTLISQYIPLKDDRWQQFNIRYIAIVVSILMATIYAYLAGFSLPTQRALVMLNLYWLSRLLGIKLTVKRLLLITLFVLLIISPFSILTASFWLSFYAVAIIFVTLWRFRTWLYKGSSVWRFLKGLFIIQISLTLMLMPITALFFQQISLVSLLANIIAVPWMSVLSIPTALISVLFMPISEPLAQWFMVFSLQSLTWLWYYLDFLSNQTYAIITLSLLQQLFISVIGIVTFVIIYLSGSLILNSVKPFAFVLLSILLGMVLLHVPIQDMIYKGTFFWPTDNSKIKQEVAEVIKDDFTPWQINFFDVGQGLSVLVKRNHHAILYDTGAAYPSGFVLSEAVILPFLRYTGIESLDKVILSHSDNDHAGGINNLVENITINEIISNDENIAKVNSVNLNQNVIIPITIPITPCKPSQSFVWQGLSFTILWPLPIQNSDTTANKYKQRNDDSCVILISDQQGNKLLLTGDISSKVEQQLLTIYPNLTTDVLQVPHHGSKTSSSQKFLSHVTPKVAIVSAGYINRWYMPVAVVKQRYYDSGINLLNSAELGQIIITVGEEGISTQSYVEDLRPFWFSH